MSWTYLNGIRYNIKNHIIHESALDFVKKDLSNRYGVCDGAKTRSMEEVNIDPGGVLNMASEPIKATFEGVDITIKPEHILSAINSWANYGVEYGRTNSGEEIYKVYLSTLEIVVLPKSLYESIGVWLAQLTHEGYSARMDIVSLLEDIPSILVQPQNTMGDA